MPEDLIASTVTAIDSMEDEHPRVNSLLAMFPYLRGEKRELALNTILETAKGDDQGWGPGWLRSIAARVSEPDRGAILADALGMAETAWDQFVCCRGLLECCSTLEEPYRSRVHHAAVKAGLRALVKEESNPIGRFSVASRLLPHLDAPSRAALLEKPLAEARSSSPSQWRLYELAFCMPFFSAEQRREVLPRVLDEVDAMGPDETWCVDPILTVLPDLTPGEQDWFLRACATSVWQSAPRPPDDERAQVGPMMRALHEIGRDDLCGRLWARWIREAANDTGRVLRAATEAALLPEVFPGLAAEAAEVIGTSLSWRW